MANRSKRSTKRRKPRELTGRMIDAMTPAEREKIYNDIDQATPEELDAEFSAPITRADRAVMKRLAKRMGRPKLGERGARHVSITVESDLLDRADAYARAVGMKRSELFSQSVRHLLAGVSAAKF